MASLLGEIFRFGVGAATAKPRPGRIADAGTSSRISPTLATRFRGGVEALSVTQNLRAGEAVIEGRQSLSDLRRSQARRASQEVLDKNEPVDLSKILGANFTPRMTQDIVDQARVLGADIDGNNIISSQEFNRILPKIPPQFIQDTIKQGTQDTQTILGQNTALLQPEIEKATKIVPGLTVENAEEMFQNNPELAKTFPKIAEALQGQAQLQQRISDLTQAGEMAKLIGKPTKRRIRILSDPITGEVKRFDIDTGERLTLDDVEPTDEVVSDITQAPTGTQVIDTEPQRFITREDLTRSTGLVSNTLQAISNMFGIAKTGLIAPLTTEARNKIRIFNKDVIQSLVINPRAPVAEQAIIQGFLIDPNRKLVDPDEAIISTLNLRIFLEDKLATKTVALQRGDIGKKTRADFTSQIIGINAVLGRIPTREQLTVQPQVITIEDVNRMTIDEIINIPAEGIPREVEDAMLRRLEEARR